MNKSIFSVVFLLLSASLPLYGCENQHHQAAAPVATPSAKSTKISRTALPVPLNLLKTPLKDPLTPHAYELASGALATWKDSAVYKPTLVLFSTHPLLDPVPAGRQQEISRLLQQGSAADIVRRGQKEAADSLFLSPETVSIAIDNDYFTAVVLVLPTAKKMDATYLADFQQRALSAGFLTAAESASLSLKDGVIVGSVRGVPLKVAHPDALPTITTPVILHVDLGYFKDLYVNEVKTPLYDLIFQAATNLRKAGYPALAVTLSYSNQEIGFSLESRFIIRDFAEIIRHPDFLVEGAKTPASWKLRASALYARVMYLDENANLLLEQAVRATPNDPAALFDLSRLLLQKGMTDEGFAQLDKAVKLDNGYGLDYYDLAQQGLKIGQVAKAIELMQKACRANPDNAIMALQLADLLIQNGRGQEALPILVRLSKLPWTAPLYTSIPEQLKQMETVAKTLRIPQPELGQTPQQALPTPAPRRKFNHMGMGMPKP